MNAKFLKRLIVLSLVVTLNLNKGSCKSLYNEYYHDPQENDEMDHDEWNKLPLISDDWNQIETDEEIEGILLICFGLYYSGNNDENDDNFDNNFMKRGGGKNKMRLNRVGANRKARNEVNIFNKI